MVFLTRLACCFVLAVLVENSYSQNACDPKDPGPYLGTKPMLNFLVEEATEEDIQNDAASARFNSELRLHGQPAEFSLSSKGDFKFLDPFDYFEVVAMNNKNYLRLKRPLDRDGLTDKPEDDINFISFTLVCEAMDTKNITEYDARIFIADINDNKPMFPASGQPIEVTITEATPVSTTILTAKASDKDANLEGNITYSLLDHTDQFSIDAISGEVTLTAELDYDKMQEKVILLAIEVKDAGPGEVQSATATATISVTDSDDLGPAFVYSGCFKHNDVCAWPKYTTGVTLKKNQPIKVLPVPNKGQGEVSIKAHDLDMGVANEIVFSIASTIPPGHENEFKVETTKGTGNEYVATIIPLADKEVNDGFEIFLKAQEKSASMKFEVSMIFFMGDGTDPVGNQGQNANDTNDDDDDSYSDRELALIVVTAILASFLFCVLIGMAVMCARRKIKSKGSDLQMGHVNGSYN